MRASRVLILERATLRTFWDRTIGFQLDRESPFSLWGWGQYDAAGIPDLGWLRRSLQPPASCRRSSRPSRPRQRGPLELAALTAAILLATQLVLTHWFYLYLPWVLPFVVLAVLAPARGRRTRPEAPDDRGRRSSPRFSAAGVFVAVAVLVTVALGAARRRRDGRTTLQDISSSSPTISSPVATTRSVPPRRLQRSFFQALILDWLEAYRAHLVAELGG